MTAAEMEHEARRQVIKSMANVVLVAMSEERDAAARYHTSFNLQDSQVNLKELEQAVGATQRALVKMEAYAIDLSSRLAESVHA
jgi:hypothetical protein